MKSEQPDFLPAAAILGVGAVTPLGRDLDAMAKQLRSPAKPTEVLRVSDEFLSDLAIGSRMRRADRFARMAAIAALDCWASANDSSANISKDRIGLIVSSGFGPHCRGFRFLDGILDCGDASALPTDFSHSVHGAAAAYITELLELRGPSMTTTDFENGFEQAVLLAQCWLQQQVCDRVLVSAVEEIGAVLLHCASRILNSDKVFVPGEGAVFLMLGPTESGGTAQIGASSPQAEADLLMLDVPAIPSTAPQRPTCSARETTTFSPYFGHSPSSSAFQLLGGYLSLTAGRPLGQLIGSELAALPHPKAVDKVATCKPSCDPHSTSLLIKRARG